MRGTHTTMRVAAGINESIGAGHCRAGLQKAICDFDEPVVIARLAMSIQTGRLAGIRVRRRIQPMIGLVPQAINFQPAFDVTRFLLTATAPTFHFPPRTLPEL